MFEDLVENVLPRQSGGKCFDYQFVEEYFEGTSNIFLHIAPCVGEIREDMVNETIYNKLRNENIPKDILSTIWKNNLPIRIVRKPPIPSKRGRVHPFCVIERHVENKRAYNK